MFTMLKKNTKYIPSHISKKDSNNNSNNNNNNGNNSDNNNIPIDKIIENKLEEFKNGNINPKSDYYDDTYRAEKLNTPSFRKAFIVKYMFSYEENVKANDISRGYRTVFHTEIEEDMWSADSVEQAILYTYKNFGHSYDFCEKYKDKKNLKLLGIYDVYVKLHNSYIPECYSERDSTWNNNFRNYWDSENVADGSGNKE